MLRSLLLLLPVLLTATPAWAWPDEEDWDAITKNGIELAEPPLDQATTAEENACDLVGDLGNPVASWYVDEEGIYFRMRVNAEPSNGDHCRGVLFETNGDMASYEYLMGVYGNDGFALLKNTFHVGGVDDVAESLLYQETLTDYERVYEAEVGSSHWGSLKEWTIDVTLSLEELAAYLEITSTDCFRVAFATADTLDHYSSFNTDLAGHDDGSGLGNMAEGLSDEICIDEDGDGLYFFLELELGSNPAVSDTDGDGLNDGEEYYMGTSPTVADTDLDGLDDGDEIAGGFDPRDPDSDGDGIEDGPESECGGEDKDDRDGDGISDSEEGVGDPDDDGAPNWCDPDADGDNIPDSEEGTGDPDGDDTPNYLDPDSDGDGRSDLDEGTGDDDCDDIENYLDTNGYDGPCAPDTADTADPCVRGELKLCACHQVPASRPWGLAFMPSLAALVWFRRRRG